MRQIRSSVMTVSSLSVYKTKQSSLSVYKTKQSLINSIMGVFTNFNREAAVTARSRVRSRLEEVVTVLNLQKHLITG